MSPRFVLGLENVPYVAEVVNRSLKADCTDFNSKDPLYPQKPPTKKLWAFICFTVLIFLRDCS